MAVYQICLHLFTMIVRVETDERFVISQLGIKFVSNKNQEFIWLLIYQFVTCRNISTRFHQLFFSRITDLSNNFKYVILFVCSLTISSVNLTSSYSYWTRKKKNIKRVHHHSNYSIFHNDRLIETSKYISANAQQDS